MSAILKPLHSLRAMQCADLPRVMALEQENYEFPWTEGIFRDCLSVGYPTRVLLDADGIVIGYAVMSIAVGEIHLLNICIERAQQRRGWGELLFREVCAMGRAEAAEMLFLEVRPSNLAAIELYAKLGCGQVGRRRGYYPAVGGREDGLVLAKPL